MIVAILVLLGLCFGSFTNALVWRLYQQSLPAKKRADKDLSILKGRSMCVDCRHTLKAIDLIPVFSWLSTGGKCRYCRKHISFQYPAVELLMVALFVLSYTFWPIELTGADTVLFAFWLASLVGLTALIIYDIRWMLLPNKIVGVLFAIAAASLIVEAIFVDTASVLINGFLAGLVGGGIFYVIFQVSKGKWIGGGDVKLGFVLGLLVGAPILAFLTIFIASLLGTITALPLIALKKVGPRARIPFGPFLIIAAIITNLFGGQVIDAYVRIVGLG